MGAEPGTILELSNVSINFGAVRALQSADLSLRSGEVHALLGTNGSGKSTLVKVLAGYHVPEPGATLRVKGAEQPISALGAASGQVDIAFVYQDLGLVDELSVLDNLLMPEFASGYGLHIPWRVWHRRVDEVLRRFRIDAHWSDKISSLSRGTRALVALARAVWNLERHSAEGGRAGRGVLVLDEITAFLSGREVDFVRDVARFIVSQGHAVLFISHDLDEVLTFADVLTVLRDGQVVGERRVAEVQRSELFELIVGRARGAGDAKPARPAARSEPLLRLREASAAGLEPTSIDLVPGELLGITGLLGSGFELLPYLMFGLCDGAAGEMTLSGRSIEIKTMSPARAMALGMALVPADRLASGVIDSLSIAENVSLARLPSLRTAFGSVSWGAVRREGAQAVEEYRIVAPGAGAPVGSLSGGNQQRALLAKWLRARPKVLLLHEPVQGVDVGARDDIAAILRRQVDEGVVVLCASSDHEFVAQVADRVLVFRNGSVHNELLGAGGKLAKDEIMWACLSTE